MPSTSSRVGRPKCSKVTFACCVKKKKKKFFQSINPSSFCTNISKLIIILPSGFLKEGCELINEALNLFNNVYGAMHVEICSCLRLLARLNYILGDHPEVGTDVQCFLFFFFIYIYKLMLIFFFVVLNGSFCFLFVFYIYLPAGSQQSAKGCSDE